MRIGDFAIVTGTNAPTVRYYEKIGLLPAPKRIRSNQRRYDRADVERLGFILRCRALGFSLEQIRQFARIAQMGGGATDQCRQIVQNRLLSVRAQLEEMKALERRLAGLLEAQSGTVGAKIVGCTKLAVLACHSGSGR